MSYNYAEQSRDVIILDMVKNGMSLNKATKEYIKGKKAAGIAVGVVSHKVEAFEYLDGLALAGTVSPSQIVADLVAEFGVVADTAMGYLKAHAEENGYEVATRMASQSILDWICDHAPAERDGDWDGFDEQFKAHMTELGKSESNINEYRKGIRLHLALMNR